jgi:Putative porin
MKKLFLLFISTLMMALAFCQDPSAVIRDRLGGFSQGSNNSSSRKSSDTTKKKGNNKLDTLGFERRDDLADSINVSFRFIDSLRRQPLDSSINDFDKYYSVPSTHQYLGNNGAAAFPLIFKPFAKPGWDAGFHAYDVYRYTLENTKFYKVSGPFSMLGYQIAGGKEQMIQALHTQNPKPNINFGFEYRLVSAPGFFKTQNANHNNIRFFGTYVGKRKRYNSSFVYLANILKSSENGGIVDDALLLDKNKKKRFSIPVNLGNALGQQPNPFQANVQTGNVYREKIFFLRQSYDLGKRDSVAINDSTTEYLFYPKLRIQHTLTSSNNTYSFTDIAVDSSFYSKNYNIIIPRASLKDTFSLYEKWKNISNDFSLIQFPDTKNASQFFLAGITLQNLKATTNKGNFNFYNVFIHGEYRNRTRNKIWDVLLKGELYANGLNSGDYNIQASLSRFLNKKWGMVDVYFNNVNRTPSFIFDNRSSFNIGNVNNYKKENIISFGGTSTNSIVRIGFNNFLITNYAYFSDFKKSDQYSKPINILQIFASKKIKLKKNIFYYADATAQQTDNAAPIKVPLLFTRSRIAYEGSVYKNLRVSTGVEIRYYTPYKANNYSPLLGQFVPQDTFIVKNKPDIAAFMHFRIRSFSAYLRAENLNTANFTNGFGFVDNNFAALHYPTQGFIIRFGIRWWFVK